MQNIFTFAFRLFFVLWIFIQLATFGICKLKNERNHDWLYEISLCNLRWSLLSWYLQMPNFSIDKRTMWKRWDRQGFAYSDRQDTFWEEQRIRPQTQAFTKSSAIGYRYTCKLPQFQPGYHTKQMVRYMFWNWSWDVWCIRRTTWR